jgi:hypothetical protein
MRVTSGEALPAARTIVRMSWRIGIALPSWTSRLAEFGKPRVNPGQSALLLAENGPCRQGFCRGIYRSSY